MPQKKRPFLAISVLIVYIALHAYLLTAMSKPYSGITLSSDQQDNNIIDKIAKDGWANTTDISLGDLVVEVDGEKKFSQQSVIHAKEITLQNDETVSSYTAPNINMSRLLQDIYIPGIFSVLTIILCIFIYQKHSKTANYLMGFLMGASLSFFTSTESGRGEIVATLVLTFSFQLGALFFTYFLHSLFYEKGIIHKKKSGLLLTNTIICFFIIFINLLDLVVPNIPAFLTSNLMLIYFSLNILFSIGFLIYEYIKNRHSLNEPFLKWMLVIQVVAFFPFIFLHALPWMLDLPFIADEIAALCLFAIPLGYSYLVITKQLLDINFILNRIRYYSILSLLPTIIISLVLIGMVNHEASPINQFIEIFLLIFVLNVLFLLIKERIDFSFRNQLFKDKTNLTQSIDQFTEKLSMIMNEHELQSALINEVIAILSPSVISLIDYDNSTASFTSNVVYGESNQFSLHKQQKWMMQTDTDSSLLLHKSAIGIKIFKKNNKTTYLWIGPKKNKTNFNINEKSWTITIVKYVRLVHENIHTITNLVNSLAKQDINEHPTSVSLSRFLFQLAERERRRLASDLHDSALQDQIVWYRKLETLINEDHTLPKDTKEQLLKIKVGMVDVIKQIRDTCNELRPNLLLEAGLIKSLKELFSQVQMRVKYNLDYDFDNITNSFEDYNKTLSIYRIFQELLNNADKHSEATYVAISMWEESDTIYIDYRDNGIGFDLNKFKQKKNHMGLSGVKERIFSLNGKVDFISEEGKGLSVHITLPR